MFTLTHTNMSIFKDCPCKFKLAIVERLRPVVEKESLVVGRAFHLYREKGWEAVEDIFNNLHPSTQEDSDRMEVNMAILKGMTKVVPDEPNVEREPEWLNPLINPATGFKSLTFNLGGKGDGLIKTEAYGGDDDYVLIEEKTRGGSIGKSDIDKLSIDAQVLNAIVNIEDSRGIRVVEVWYRYVRKPSIRQKKDETLDHFCERVVEDYIERPDFYWHEERLTFPRNQIEGFRENLWEIGKALLWTRRKGLWYKNSSRCAEWGGCPYLPMCRGEDTTGLYRQVEVNPELQEGGRNEFVTREKV